MQDLRREFPGRWSAAAIAAALTLPADTRDDRSQWLLLIDALDDAIGAVVWRA